MILTPKNWKSFQHYKDRSPAWIKLHRGILDDFEFCCLPVASRALAPFLWLLASEYEDGRIVTTLDALAFRLRMTRGDVADALAPLIEGGFFSASEPLAECLQPACLEKEDIEKIEEEIESPPVAKATRPRSMASDLFEEFWQERPRRKGDDPRKPAEDQFQRLVKSGEDPDAIIAGVKLARAAYTEQGKIETEYVPQMVKWLRDRRYRDFAEATNPTEPTVETGFYAKFGSEELDAWDAHAKAKSGKTWPRDKNGGWRFPYQWPPGYEPAQRTRDAPPIAMQSMT